ncbi:MAG: cyclic nucleotide-binding domain-containing protein [Proteobacteria bacterium]|nr:cyclic nucleotide-binding domain-containing protein [Pseudomonadota bacterium]
MKRVRICSVSDVPAGGMKGYDTDLGVRVLVVNSGECFHAYQGLCPHQDVCLDEGYFDGSTLTCHQHLWQWDVATGEPMGAAEAPLERYDIEERDGEIYVLQTSALKACELFKGVADATLARLDAIAVREEHDSLATVYDMGDPADDLYILESGRVEFVIGREDRTSLAGFMLRKGEMFGWAALLEEQPRRIARAVCMEKSMLLRFSGKAMLDALAAEPAAGFLVMRQLSALITKQLWSQGGQ